RRGSRCWRWPPPLGARASQSMLPPAQFVRVTVSVLPGGPSAGDATSVGCRMVSAAALDVRFSDGVNTVTLTLVEVVAISAAGMFAVSWVAVAKGGWRAVPPILTTESGGKFEPFTVSVKSGP